MFWNRKKELQKLNEIKKDLKIIRKEIKKPLENNSKKNITVILTLLTIMTIICYNLFDAKPPDIHINNLEPVILGVSKSPVVFIDDVDPKRNFTLHSPYATELLILNNNQFSDIALTNMRVHISNVKIDYTPKLYAIVFQYEHGLTFNLYNSGWQRINNLNITISDPFFNTLFLSDSITMNIDSIDVGEHKTIDLDINELINKEFISSLMPGTEIILEPMLDFKYDNMTELPLCDQKLYFKLTDTGVEYFAIGGRGGEMPEIIYGIIFNTDVNTQDIQFPIAETIGAHQILRMPVFVFPNKSCEFTFYVEYEYFSGNSINKINTIKTPTKTVKYTISSLDDISTYDASKLNQDYNDGKFISYPYIDLNKS